MVYPVLTKDNIRWYRTCILKHLNHFSSCITIKSSFIKSISVSYLELFRRILLCNIIHFSNVFCNLFSRNTSKTLVFFYSKVFCWKSISITLKTFPLTIDSPKFLSCCFCSTCTMSSFRITTKYKYSILTWCNIAFIRKWYIILFLCSLLYSR